MKRIYLDTNIWNAICNQGVDAKTLLASLAAKDATLVVSPHTVYELARTFTGKKPTSRAQGVKLFSCVKAFLDLGVLCSKELMELLRDEALAYQQGKADIETLLHGKDRDTVSEEVSKLANGIVEKRVEEFIAARTAHAQNTRAAQIDHFVNRPALKTKLQQILEPQLSQWLTSETLTDSGVDILRGHLERMFGQAPPKSYALNLLHSPVGRAARGLVRADLYYNWRCANRNSNPPDLMDDMLHVLQAIYSDVYATGESKQSDYAALLLGLTIDRSPR